MRRFDSTHDDLSETADGPWVLYDDAQAAIAEAYRRGFTEGKVAALDAIITRHLGILRREGISAIMNITDPKDIP